MEKTPAAFGSFTTRLVLLLPESPGAGGAGEKEGKVGAKGGAQKRMWDLVESALRKRFDEKEGRDEKEWEETRRKIDGFRGAYGTVSTFYIFSLTLLSFDLVLAFVSCGIVWGLRADFSPWATGFMVNFLDHDVPRTGPILRRPRKHRAAPSQVPLVL